MEVTAQMYTPSNYGFRAVGATTMKVFICPCGEILTPPGLNSSTQTGCERDLFVKSLAAALAHRAENGGHAAATGVDSIHALLELRAKIATLQDQVDHLSGLGPGPQVTEAADHH